MPLNKETEPKKPDIYMRVYVCLCLCVYVYMSVSLSVYIVKVDIFFVCSFSYFYKSF